jgi:hypothetical protein
VKVTRLGSTARVSLDAQMHVPLLPRAGGTWGARGGHARLRSLALLDHTVHCQSEECKGFCKLNVTKTKSITLIFNVEHIGVWHAQRKVLQRRAPFKRLHQHACCRGPRLMSVAIVLQFTLVISCAQW